MLDSIEITLPKRDEQFGNSNDTEVPLLPPKQPTVLQRLRYFKNNHDNAAKAKDLRRQIRDSSNQAKYARAGRRIEFREYSSDEYIAWAFSYARNHESTLQSEIFGTIEDVVKYQNHKKAVGNQIGNIKGLDIRILQKNSKSERNKLAPKSSSTITAASIAQQLDKCSVEGLETFMLSQFQVARRRSRLVTKHDLDQNARRVVSRSTMISESTPTTADDKDIISSRRRGSRDNAGTTSASVSGTDVLKTIPVPPLTSKPSANGGRGRNYERDFVIHI